MDIINQVERQEVMADIDHIEDEILIDTHVMIVPEDAGGKVVITSSGIMDKMDSKS